MHLVSLTGSSQHPTPLRRLMRPAYTASFVRSLTILASPMKRRNGELHSDGNVYKSVNRSEPISKPRSSSLEGGFFLEC